MWIRIIRFGLVSIFYPCLMIFGTIGNVLCLKILLRKRFRRQSTCQYLCILAVIDILFIYMRSTRYLYRHIKSVDLRNTSLWICRSIVFFSSTLSHLASWILVIVNFDRYFIMKNLFPYRRAGWRVFKSTCVLVFIVCFVNIHYFYILGVNMKFSEAITHNNATTFNETLSYGIHFVCIASSEFQRFFRFYIPIFDLLFVAIIPFVLMVFTNVGIIRTTRRTNILSTSRKQKRNNRLTIMLLSVTLAFMLLTCPWVIHVCINRLRSFGMLSDTEHVILDLLESLWYTKHVLNFILYTLSGQDFRREFRKLISCSKRTTTTDLRYQRRQKIRKINLMSTDTFTSTQPTSSYRLHLRKSKRKRQHYKGNNQSTMSYSKSIQEKIIDDGESTVGGECDIFNGNSNTAALDMIREGQQNYSLTQNPMLT